jgi:hypothetical protein
MRNAFTVAAAALAAIAALPVPPVLAQGQPQTVAAVDVKVLATGYRSSKIVGSSVVNDRNETVGKIDDLIIARNDRALFAVLSVGGFLGVGNKLIAVPYAELKPDPGNAKFVLAGATKDSLKSLPAYQYAR